MAAGPRRPPRRRLAGSLLAADLLAAGLLAVGLLTTGCGEDRTPPPGNGLTGELVVFHAGSLSVPFRELSALFGERHPGVTVRAEAAGSRDTARKVSDLGRPCDVLGSADFAVIDNLLIPEHAVFNIRFATNELVIAYTPHSRGQDRVDAANWPRLLLEEEIAFGRADPNSDPCGYRTAMVFQLAERHYGPPGLAEALLAKHGDRFLRPKETDLLALLEAGEIDYLPIYRSVAQQHELRFVILPDEINLKSPALADLYATAVVAVTGKKPGETITRTGAPMVYGVTIPADAPNPAAAEAYVALLLSPEGQEIMERHGQPCLRPAVCGQPDALPPALAEQVR